MQGKRLWSWIFFLSCLSGTSWAGDFLTQVRFEHITQSDGLSQSTIQSMYQDERGFLWIGTQDGLNKYDGYGFEVFRSIPFRTDALNNSFIRQIIGDGKGSLWVLTQAFSLARYDLAREVFTNYRVDALAETGTLADLPRTLFIDHAGTLWLGTEAAGLYSFDGKSGQFINYRHEAQRADSLSHNRVTAIFEDSNGALWVATGGGGLNRMHGRADSFSHYLPAPSGNFPFGLHMIPRTPGQSPICEDLEGKLWIITSGGGLVRLDPQTGDVARFRHDPNDPQTLDSNLLRTMFRDSGGKLWIRSNKSGINLFDPLTGITTRHKPDQANPYSIHPDQKNPYELGVHAITEDLDGVVWIAAEGGGLSAYDRSRGFFHRFTSDHEDASSLNDDAVTTLFVDRLGTLWVGTLGGGLNKFNRTKQKFRHFTKAPDLRKGLPDNRIYSLFQDRAQRFWVGTRRAGLSLFDLATGRVLRQYSHDPNDPHSLPANPVRCLFEDREGRFWVGTEGGHLALFNPQTGQFRSFSQEQHGYSAANLTRIIQDRSGRLWFAAWRSGLLTFHENTRQFEAFPVSDIENSPANFINVIEEDELGHIWVGSMQGLHLFVPGQGFTRHHLHHPDNPQTPAASGILSIYPRRQNEIWIGTYGGGLDRFNPESAQFTHFTWENQAIPNGTIYAILPDEDGFLWLATNAGLSRFNPRLGTGLVFDESDGLQSLEFNRGAYFRNERGEMFLGGVNGFNWFHPQALPSRLQPPPLAFTALTIGDRLSTRAFFFGETVSMGPGDRNFSISFAALDFANPQKNRFAYMLEGFDPDWIETTAHTAAYTNLDGGRYRFRLRGANGDGVWSQDEAILNLEIIPVFYKRPAFILAEIFLGLFLLLSGFWLQKRRLEVQKKQALLTLELGRKTQELEFARKVQLSMLPKQNLDNEHLQVFGAMRTASDVGGDFYDFAPLDDGHYYLAIGDATGHGMAAGLVVGMTKMVTTYWKRCWQGSVSDLIEDINFGLKRSLTQKGLGMAFCAARLNPENGRVALSSAGMPFPYHYRAAARSLEPLPLKGLPLGFVHKIQPNKIEVQLQPHDFLIFLSDGFAERFNQHMELWGNQRLAFSLSQICRRAAEAEQVADHLFEASDLFAGGKRNQDDMTILVVHYRQNHSS